MHCRWLVFIACLAAAGATPAQGSAPPEPMAPRATTVGSAEIKTALQLNEAGAFADSVLRVVPIESGYNIGVSVVRRSQVNGETPPDAIVHDTITEVYQIVEGKGVLVTGGTLESPTPFPNDGQIVRQYALTRSSSSSCVTSRIDGPALAPIPPTKPQVAAPACTSSSSYP